MILSLKVINSDATLNNFQEIGSAKFVPNQSLKIAMRLMQTERNLRYVPDSAATVSVTFKQSTGPDIVKAASFVDTGDRSLILVELTDLETANLISQSLYVTVTEGSDVSIAYLSNALQNAHVNGC